MTGKPNRAERIINFLEARYPGWVPAIELEPVGGRCGWRTATSEARKILRERGDDIENRVQYQVVHSVACRYRRRDGKGECICNAETWILSSYRIQKRGESAQTPQNDKSLALDNGVNGSVHGDLRARNEAAPRDCHDLNDFSLR